MYVCNIFLAGASERVAPKDEVKMLHAWRVKVDVSCLVGGCNRALKDMAEMLEESRVLVGTFWAREGATDIRQRAHKVPTCTRARSECSLFRYSKGL